MPKILASQAVSVHRHCGAEINPPLRHGYLAWNDIVRTAVLKRHLAPQHRFLKALATSQASDYPPAMVVASAWALSWELETNPVLESTLGLASTLVSVKLMQSGS